MAKEDTEAEQQEPVAPAPSSESQLGKILAQTAILSSLICLAGSVGLIYMSTFGFIPPTVTEKDVYEQYIAKRETESDDPAIYTLEPFSVNLSGAPKRSVRVQISLHMLSEDGFEEIGGLDAEARDSIVRLLGQKSFRDLETIQGKLFLKQQIAMNLNKRLREGVIKDVYFNEFIIR